MIVALWYRWIQSKQWRWLVITGAVIILDLLIGTWLIAWELRFLKEVMLP